ncbi:MAG: phosphotransferase [Rhodospirillales bacterium]|nr:phosphotransferase [Rhodospirillales bacterium]
MTDPPSRAARDKHIQVFLVRAGWGKARRAPLAGDASFRRYERLEGAGARAVLMDAPPPHEDVAAFLAIARHLVALGFSAPRIYADDVGAGLVLLEDLGDDTFTRVLAGPDGGVAEKSLYALAVDLLVDLHHRPAHLSIPAGLADYDSDALLEEAMLLIEWYLPVVRGARADADQKRAYEQVWREAFASVPDGPRTLVLRDFHVDNLIRIRDRRGISACGLVDFQDALAGHPAYDLMSLLEDARRDIASDLAAAMRERYARAFPDCDRADFDTAYAVLGAGRHAKVIGIFTRLSHRDAKPGYLAHIPRVWRLLEGSLAHPALSAVKEWMDRHLPAQHRKVPPCRAVAE